MAFKPRKIIDPRTGKARIVSVKEQQFLLAKGILFDVPFIPNEDSNPLPSSDNPGEKDGQPT